MTIGFTWKTPLFIRACDNKFKTGFRYIELILQYLPRFILVLIYDMAGLTILELSIDKSPFRPGMFRYKS